MIDIAIYIGRFQPFHVGHYDNCVKALARAKKLIILIGSSGIGPLPNNPWSFDERCHMILQAMPEAYHSRIQFLPLYDSLYDQAAWETRVKKLIDVHAPVNTTKSLVTFAKDDSSFYLDCFPEWQQMHLPMVVDDNNVCISATDIRAHLYEYQSVPEGVLPDAVESFVMNGLKYQTFSHLALANKALKVKQTNQTTQYLLVLIYQDTILLEQRQEPLGYQQWALPTWDDVESCHAFLAKNFPNTEIQKTESILSSMLKLPYEITYVNLSQPSKQVSHHQFISAQMVMTKLLFADHRSILYDPMSLKF